MRTSHVKVRNLTRYVPQLGTLRSGSRQHPFCGGAEFCGGGELVFAELGQAAFGGFLIE